MCPICLSTLAWAALGGGSASTMAALLLGWRSKGEYDGNARN